MIGGEERTTVDLYACADCESVAIDQLNIKHHDGHVIFKRRFRGTEVEIWRVVHKAREDMQRQFSPKGFRPLRFK